MTPILVDPSHACAENETTSRVLGPRRGFVRCPRRAPDTSFVRGHPLQPAGPRLRKNQRSVGEPDRIVEASYPVRMRSIGVPPLTTPGMSTAAPTTAAPAAPARRAPVCAAWNAAQDTTMTRAVRS